MVPVNLWSAVFFLVLVAPGLLHDLMSETRTARQKESAFREISRVVLASLGFSAVPMLAITLLGDLAVVDWLPNPSKWAELGSNYAVDNYAAIVVSLVLQCVSSCALVWVFHRLRHGGDPRLVAKPTWRKVFRDDNPTHAAPIVRVRTSSGSTYVGRLADYTQSWDEDRDLVLGPPLQVKPQGGKAAALHHEWQRIIIPSSSILSITVRYMPDTAPPTAPPADSQPAAAEPAAREASRRV